MACSCFAKIKCTIALILVFYFLYLVNYKCVELKENPLHSRVDQVFHPLARHHAYACELIEKGHHFVQPYLDSAHAFLDDHVHSHPKFKEYEVEKKIEAAKAHYHTVADPWVQKLWQFVDSAEQQAYDHGSALVGEAQKFIKAKTD